MIIFSKIFLFLVILQTVLFSQNQPLKEVKLQLQWKYQFQFAGFIMAKELGYYKDVGLDVAILEYNNTNSIEDLEDGKVDYAINNSLLVYHKKKLNAVTLVATYFQRSPLIIIAQPEIKSVLDLKDKKIMMSENNRYNSSLSILLEYFNINSKNTTFINPSFDINDFINKKVDAVTGFRSNELFILNKKGVPYTVIDPVEYGFSTNAINLFVSQKKVKNNPKEIQDFLEATKKGWLYALSHINEVAKLIHDKYAPSKGVEHLAYEGEITKQLMLLNLYDIGEVNRDFVLKTYEQLIKSGRLDTNQTADKIMLEKTSDQDVSTLVMDLIKVLREKIDRTTAIIVTVFFLIVLLLKIFWSHKVKMEVTKRILMQKELERSEQRYISFFKSNLAIELIIDPSSQTVVDCNKSAEKFYGYTHDEFVNLPISTLNVMSADEIQAEMEKAKDLKQNKFNFRHRLANGDIRDVEVYSGPIEMEDKTYLYSIVFDVTERKKLQNHQESIQKAYKLTLRTKHNLEQKEKVSYARRVFTSVAVATVVKFQRSQMILYLFVRRMV